MNKQLIEEICQLPIRHDTKYLTYNYRNGDWICDKTYTALARQIAEFTERPVDPKLVYRCAVINRNNLRENIQHQWSSYLGQFFTFEVCNFPFTIGEDIITRSNYLREQARLLHRTRVELLDKRTLFVYRDFSDITDVLKNNKLSLDYLHSCLQNDKQQLDENLFARYMSDSRHWVHFEQHYEVA